MPIYSYTARDLQGVDHKGTVETTDLSRASRILSNRGLVVISIEETQEDKGSLFDRIFNRVSFSDVVVATRQLATMVESGLVLSESLDILVEQQTNKKFKAALAEISRDVKGGLDLASAFKKHPDIFPPLYSNLVRAGEQAGNLDIVLVQMADNLEKDREFRSKLRGAMIYPIIVIMMMGGVMLIMMLFVVPRITGLYTQSNIELPLPTKILIGMSQFLVSFWWLVGLSIAGAVFAFKQWIKTEKGRYRFDYITLHTPIVGKIVKGAALTNFTRTFGLLSTAGIPILDTLNIVAGVIGNTVYQKALEETYKGVERGLSLSAQMDAVGVFPKLISQMFRVGEETGKIDKVSFKMASYFESESDQLLKNITVIIEPVILVVLGVGVAFLVLSIILPIYKLTSSFS